MLFLPCGCFPPPSNRFFTSPALLAKDARSLFPPQAFSFAESLLESLFWPLGPPPLLFFAVPSLTRFLRAPNRRGIFAGRIDVGLSVPTSWPLPGVTGLPLFPQPEVRPAFTSKKTHLFILLCPMTPIASRRPFAFPAGVSCVPLTQVGFP